MKIALASLTLATGLITSVAFAAAPSDAPAGTTGLCKDGTYISAASKQGACRGHKGIKDWYVAAAGMPAGAASGAAPGAPAAMDAPAAKSAAAPKTAAAARAAAPGGGPGQVWVNTATKVYHCQSDKSYGKTKQGQYMTEDAAKAAGDRPSHGKACAA